MHFTLLLLLSVTNLIVFCYHYSIIDILTALKINALIFKVYLNLLKILRPLSLCKNAFTMKMLEFVKHIYLVSVMFRFQLAEI